MVAVVTACGGAGVGVVGASFGAVVVAAGVPQVPQDLGQHLLASAFHEAVFARWSLQKDLALAHVLNTQCDGRQL